MLIPPQKLHIKPHTRVRLAALACASSIEFLRYKCRHKKARQADISVHIRMDANTEVRPEQSNRMLSRQPCRVGDQQGLSPKSRDIKAYYCSIGWLAP